MVDHVQSKRTSHQAQASRQPRAEGSSATAGPATSQLPIHGFSRSHYSRVCPGTEQRCGGGEVAYFGLHRGDVAESVYHRWGSSFRG